MLRMAILLFACVLGVQALVLGPKVASRTSQLALNAEVEIVFPNKKKVMAASGTPLKAAAAKAGFKPNYGCDEGKCGSCELICNGKTKIRPCIGKVPASATSLTNP